MGLAIAERLVADGYALGFATHDPEEQTAERLAERGPVHPIVGDLSDAAVPARLVDETVDALGRLDVLIGGGHARTPEEVAALVAWLVSDDARYVTGASYVVDGGLVQQVVEDPTG